MDNQVEYVSSQKGVKKVHFQGYRYIRHKNLSRDVVSYHCEMRRKGECKVSMKVLDDQCVGILHEHTHAPDQVQSEVQRIRATIRERAETSEEPAQRILTAAAVTISEGASARMAPVPDLHRNVRRQRRRVDGALPEPESPAAMLIPEKYKTTGAGEQFLQYDGGVDNPDRILIFSTTRNLDLLARSQHWFADGTFKTVPQLYYQLFTIHCLTSKAVIPCVYALMPNKQETTYREVFAKVKELAPDCTPDTLMLDFEKAIWNAAASEFLGIEVKGCFYHLNQNIYRRIQSAGLQAEYAASPELQMQSMVIPALAFIPEDQVVDAFESLAEDVQIPTIP